MTKTNVGNCYEWESNIKKKILRKCKAERSPIARGGMWLEKMVYKNNIWKNIGHKNSKSKWHNLFLIVTTELFEIFVSHFFHVVLCWKLWRSCSRDKDIDSTNHSTVCPYSPSWLVQTYLHESWTARLYTRWDEEYLGTTGIKPLLLPEYRPLTSVLQQCRSCFKFSSWRLSV